MNLFYAQEYFGESLSDFATMIAQMRKDLERYATQKDAKQGYITKQNELIARMMSNMQAFKDVVEFYQAEVDRVSQKNAEEYQRGYAAGISRGHGDIRDTMTDADNEKLRALNMKKALKKWADHLT